MDKHIVLMCDSQSFMINAIKSALEAERFYVIFITPAPDEVDGLGEGTHIILMYLGDYISTCEETLIKIKDLIYEYDTKVYIIGSPEEFKILSKTLPLNLVNGVFERPLNVKNLVMELNLICSTEVDERGRKKILVIDDDSVMLRTIKNWLSDQYHVIMANSGMSGITFLAKNKVDPILLDYEMPVTNGAEIMEMLQQNPETATIPVMFLTGKGDKESVHRVIDLKPAGYILKTQPPKEIIKTIDKFFLNKVLEEEDDSDFDFSQFH